MVSSHQLAIGSRVEAIFHGSWFPARIRNRYRDGSYCVLWSGPETSTNVLRRAEIRLATDSRVEAKVYGSWFPAIIESWSQDGTCNVHWEGEDESTNGLCMTEVRPIGSGSPELFLECQVDSSSSGVQIQNCVLSTSKLHSDSSSFRSCGGSLDVDVFRNSEAPYLGVTRWAASKSIVKRGCAGTFAASSDSGCYNCIAPTAAEVGKRGPLVLGGRGIAELMYVPTEHVGEFRLQSDICAERFWSWLPWIVPEHKSDGWVLRISYGGWIKHGPDTAHYHAHLHIEAPSVLSFNDVVSMLRWKDDVMQRKMPSTYPTDPSADAKQFLLWFVPELQDMSFFDAVNRPNFSSRWRNALYTLGIALGLEPASGDGASLCISNPQEDSTYMLRCCKGHDFPLSRFESQTPQQWESEALAKPIATQADANQAYWREYHGGEEAYWNIITESLHGNHKRRLSIEGQRASNTWKRRRF